MYVPMTVTPVRVAVAVPGLLLPPIGSPDGGVAEHRRHVRAVVQHAERAGQVELGVDVVVELRVDLMAVERERA